MEKLIPDQFSEYTGYLGNSEFGSGAGLQPKARSAFPHTRHQGFYGSFVMAFEVQPFPSHRQKDIFTTYQIILL
jgi:hypothetical protein